MLDCPTVLKLIGNQRKGLGYEREREREGEGERERERKRERECSDKQINYKHAQQVAHGVSGVGRMDRKILDSDIISRHPSW